MSHYIVIVLIADGDMGITWVLAGSLCYMRIVERLRCVLFSLISIRNLRWIEHLYNISQLDKGNIYIYFRTIIALPLLIKELH